MGDMDKSEKFTAAGYLFIPIGMFMFADADVVMRCYGDERAALIEFIIGVIAVVIATVSLYIGRYASRPPHPSGVRPPSRRARAPQGRTGEPGMVTPWGTREGALWHVAHIDRY